ncbi:MAG: hypothetical protein ABF990_11790 [Acetobacter sp.]|uniref:hypothetical protein n=1 Tax=Acetobacter sp. TaxID=440 RepID=UPI0039EC8D84
MDLLISANTVVQTQADQQPASGTPGWATDGNAAEGILATDFPAWHYNMMMSELLAFVKAAGITADNTDWSQTLKAAQTLFAPAQRGVAPYNAALSTLIGGYPKFAIVVDSAGAFWVSTADANTTVPGADGAKWQSLFNGYATQVQVGASIGALAGRFQSGGTKVYYTGSSDTRAFTNYHTAPVAGTYIVWAGVNVGAPPGATQPAMAALDVYYNGAPGAVVADSTPLSMSHCITIPAAAGANTIGITYTPSSTSGTWYAIGLSLFYLFIPAT